MNVFLKTDRLAEWHQTLDKAVGGGKANVASVELRLWQCAVIWKQLQTVFI
jgi:hypothetical protein